MQPFITAGHAISKPEGARPRCPSLGYAPSHLLRGVVWVVRQQEDEEGQHELRHLLQGRGRAVVGAREGRCWGPATHT